MTFLPTSRTELVIAMRRDTGRGKASAGGGSTGMAATPALSFSIPLKDTSKPVAFPGDFQNHIALEFAMRYLSKVGAGKGAIPPQFCSVLDRALGALKAWKCEFVGEAFEQTHAF